MTLEKLSLTIEETTLKQLAAFAPRVVDFLYRRELPAHKTTTLLNAIERSLPEDRGSLLLFAGTDSGEETARIAFETAHAAALQRQTPVLFLNLSETAWSDSTALLQKEKPIPLDGFIRNKENKHSPFIALQGNGLFYAVLREAGQNLQIQTLKKLLDELRQQFSLVVTYSGTALADGTAVTFGGFAEGTVIVVEAERTRGPVARELKKAIESHEGNIIGTILTGRRFYIPRFLYRFLYKKSK